MAEVTYTIKTPEDWMKEKMPGAYANLDDNSYTVFRTKLMTEDEFKKYFYPQIAHNVIHPKKAQEGKKDFTLKTLASFFKLDEEEEIVKSFNKADREDKFAIIAERHKNK